MGKRPRTKPEEESQESWGERLNLDEAATEVPAAPLPPPPALPVLSLPGDQPLLMRALRAELKAAEAMHLAKLLERELFLARVDPEGKFLKLTEEANARKNQVDEARATLERAELSRGP